VNGPEIVQVVLELSNKHEPHVMALCPCPDEFGPMPVSLKFWLLRPRLTMAEAGTADSRPNKAREESLML
jgi:hypothetical protein